MLLSNILILRRVSDVAARPPGTQVADLERATQQRKSLATLTGRFAGDGLPAAFERSSFGLPPRCRSARRQTYFLSLAQILSGKAGVHPGSSPGQAFSGMCARRPARTAAGVTRGYRTGRASEITTRMTSSLRARLHVWASILIIVAACAALLAAPGLVARDLKTAIVAPTPTPTQESAAAETTEVEVTRPSRAKT
jgi:hypothetical protein